MLHKHSDEHRNPRILVHSHEEIPEVALLSSQLQKLSSDELTPTEVSLEETKRLANKYNIPKNGIKPELAYQLIHNELTLDGNPHLNLASFVNTFTTETAKRLVNENINKNLADNDEYPQLIEITQRCISILAEIWHCDPKNTPIGCSTTGSSEAVMLGGLAMKKRWEHKMQDKGKDFSKPNIVMSCACQVALEKFARYFEVECRLVPVSQESNYCLDPKILHEYVDENTIGVFVIMGTTYTGHLENVHNVSLALGEIEKKHPDWANLEIPIHVDGASGGFIVPFSYDRSQLEDVGLNQWCFNEPRVVSINTSSHKFGLTTPGLGWVLWKDESLLPSELRFRLKYLGGIEETFNLNFSRPGFQVIHQYFNFMSMGFNGYKEHFRKSIFVARAFSYGLLKSEKLKGHIDIVSCIHKKIENGSIPENVNDYLINYKDYSPGIPLVAFKLSNQFMESFPEIPQAIISSLLRARGWIIPNYPLPKSSDDSEHWEVLRVVFRTEMKLDLAQLLLFDIEMVLERLVKSYTRVVKHITDKKLSEETKRSFIYDMLLTLASPETALEDEESENEEHHEAVKERTKRNYRGTC